MSVTYSVLVENYFAQAFYGLWEAEAKGLRSSLSDTSLSAEEKVLLESSNPPFSQAEDAVYQSVMSKTMKPSEIQWIDPTLNNLNWLNSALRSTLEIEYGLPSGSLNKSVIEHSYQIEAAKEQLKTGEALQGGYLADYDMAVKGEEHNAQDRETLPFVKTSDSIMVSKEAIEKLGNMGKTLFYWAGTFLNFAVSDVIEIKRGHSTADPLGNNPYITAHDAVSYTEALTEWECLHMAQKVEGIPGLKGLSLFESNFSHIEHYSMKYAKTIPMGIVVQLQDLELTDRAGIDSVHYYTTASVKGGGFYAPLHNAIFWDGKNFDDSKRKSANLVASMFDHGVVRKIESPKDYDEHVFKPIMRDVQTKQFVGTPNLWGKNSRSAVKN